MNNNNTLFEKVLFGAAWVVGIACTVGVITVIAILGINPMLLG